MISELAYVKMTSKSVTFFDFCHYLLYWITFIILFVFCYVLYMNEAIEKSRARETTVTKQSENFPYEVPSILLCPEPGFKQSALKYYNLTSGVNHLDK